MHPLTEQAVAYRNAAIGLIDLHADRKTDPDKLADAITRQAMSLRLRLDRLNEAVTDHMAGEVRAYDARCHEILTDAGRMETEAAAADRAALETIRGLYSEEDSVRLCAFITNRSIRSSEGTRCYSEARKLIDQVGQQSKPADRQAPADTPLTRERIAELNPEQIINLRAAIYATATK